MNNLKTITSLLILLKREELEEISKTVAAMLGPVKNKSVDSELFYKIVNKHFGNDYPALSVLAKTVPKLEKRIANSVVFLDNYLEAVFECHYKVTGIRIHIIKSHKVILYSFFATIVTEWLIDIGVPNSLKSLLTNVDKFPALMEKQFPGYKLAGLLVPFVFNKLHTSVTYSAEDERNGEYVHLHNRTQRVPLRKA